eukprot:156453-Prorocentrum_lima.AAC.1
MTQADKELQAVHGHCRSRGRGKLGGRCNTGGSGLDTAGVLSAGGRGKGETGAAAEEAAPVQASWLAAG